MGDGMTQTATTPQRDYIGERMQGWEADLQRQLDQCAPGVFKVTVTSEQYWRGEYSVTRIGSTS